MDTLTGPSPDATTKDTQTATGVTPDGHSLGGGGAAGWLLGKMLIDPATGITSIFIAPTLAVVWLLQNISHVAPALAVGPAGPPARHRREGAVS